MAILLRKLSRKSTLNFGQYADMTVQQVIDLHHHLILRWYYFNSSNITFFDDILDELSITEEYRIEKPGKNPELGRKLDEVCRARAFAYVAGRAEAKGNNPDAAKMGLHARIEARTRRKSWSRFRNYQREDSRWNTKSVLQAINHGHI